MRLAHIALTFAFSVALAVVPASAQDKPMTADDIEKILPQSKQLTADDIDELFKNSSPVKPTSGGTLLDRLRSEVEACWNLPRYNPDDILPETELTANVARDGSLLGDPVVSKSGKGALAKRFAESAVKAIKRCAPFKTVKDNPDSYETLKTIKINFTPSAL